MLAGTVGFIRTASDCFPQLITSSLCSDLWLPNVQWAVSRNISCKFLGESLSEVGTDDCRAGITRQISPWVSKK